MIKLSVKKPYTVLVGVIMVLVLGFVALTRMTADLLPEMSLPYMIVITTYPGASPERVETLVSEPMESSLGTISGVENVYSVSSENYSMVELEFEDGTDMDSAMVKVSGAVTEVAATLPDECGTPNIMEISMDMMATMYVAVSREGSDIYELSDYVNDTVVPYLERQDGVASVNTVGLVEKSVQVELNADKVDEINARILALTNNSLNDALSELNSAEKKVKDGQAELEAQESTFGATLADGVFSSVTPGVEEQAAALRKQLQQLQSSLGSLMGAVGGTSVEGQSLQSAYSKLNGIDSELAALENGGSVSDLMRVVTDLQSVTGSLSGTAAVLNSELAAQTAQSATESLAQAETPAAAPVSALDDTEGGEGGSEGGEGGSGGGEATPTPEPEATPTAEPEATATPEPEATATAEPGTTPTAVPTSLPTSIPTINPGTTLTPQQLAAIVSGLNSALDGMSTLLANVPALMDGMESLTAALSQAELSAAVGFSTATVQLSTAQTQLESAREQYESARETALKSANLDQLLSLSTLSGILYAQNFSMPAGYIDDTGDNSWLLKIGDGYSSVDELAQTLLVHMDDIGDIRLQDVADVTVIDNADDSYARLNGEAAVVLSIFKGSTAGTNDVAKRCTAAFGELEEKYAGTKIITLMNQGDYITMIVNSVVSSMVIGAALAIVILALFLKDIKPTIIVGISIPLSVLFAIVLMYFSDLSLNMMTLSGLALGIGMLVDNSIVSMENIYRLRSRGVAAARAAVQGTKQVAGSIIASTLTTICVFLPMVFTNGTVRELLVPMGLSIAYCLTASLIVAMTVVPAAGSTILRNAKPKTHPWFDKVQDVYGTALQWCLAHKAAPLAGAVALLVFSVVMVTRTGIVIIPSMTTDEISVSITTPEEMDRETSYETADAILQAIGQVDGVEDVGAMSASAASSMISSSLSSDAYGSYTCYITAGENAGEAEINRICADIEAAAAGYDAEVTASAGGMSDMSAMMSSGLSLNIFGDDPDTLESISSDVIDLINGTEGFENATNGLEEGDATVHLIIDRDAAMRLGLTNAQIYSTVAGKLTTSATAVTVTIDGEEMDVVVVDNTDPLLLENLLNLEFETTGVTDENGDDDNTHTLSEFATEEKTESVQSINRENQTRYLTVSADTADGYNTTLLSRTLEQKLEAYETTLPDGYSIVMSGESEQVNDMIVQMLELMAVALIFVYLVMVAQFQSLLSPFIVLFTVPLAFTGGMIGLLIAGQQLSLLSLMGFLVLMGTVVNNGIVFVDYTNQLRLGGMERRPALIAAGKTRMRPILMTALTTILAMAQLIFGDDMGSQMGSGMAIVIAGGLLYATIMTLFIVPVVYDLLFRRPPMNVDVGGDDLDDVPDDAAEFIAAALEHQRTVEGEIDAENPDDPLPAE